MKTTVVIGTYNREHLLGDTLRCVIAQDLPDHEIVVVDNNSRDGTRGLVERVAATSRVPIRHVLEERQGLSHARNTGIRHAAGDLIVFTDDDVQAESGWLRALVAPFADPRVAAAGGPIRPLWQSPRPAWLTDRWLVFHSVSEFPRAKMAGRFVAPEYPWGGNLAVRRGILEKLGSFTTDLGRIGERLLSNEEILLCRKIERSGGRIAFVPDAAIHHTIQPARLTKGWLYRRVYWQGRSQAILDGKMGINVHDRMIRKMAGLRKEIRRADSSDFDRRCTERELFGYIYQMVKGTHEETRLVDALRSLRTVKTMLALLNSSRFREESVRRIRRPRGPS